MFLDFAKNIDLESLSPQNEFEEKVISFLGDWYSPSPTVSVQTSGSTGIPKVFKIEKEKMRNSANMTCDFLGLKEGNSALLCLPVEYISGKMMVVRAAEKRLKLFVKTPSSQPLSDLNQEIDFCAMSPLQVENSLDSLHWIKNLIIGGAAVSENLKTKIGKVLNTAETQAFETYGMSETLSHIGLKQIFPQAEEYFSVFNGVDISLDERGCLKIFAPKLNPNVLQTNDLVEILNNETPLKFKFSGRIDNVINSGGLKIHPEVLESFLKKDLENELLFVGIPDEKLGQKLILVIEGDETAALKGELSSVLDNLAEVFSKNHKPKSVHFLKKFPRIPNGKVNRQEIITKLSHEQ